MADPKNIGKYEIIEEIGRGGFAVVYKARDPDLDRVVALKVLAPHLTWDPTFAERFRREARATANLRHPHVVTIHEVGQADEHLYIAMEYLSGATLAELLKADGAMPLDRALPILEQVADALDYAHGQGAIHRDVKPSNVMVEETARGLRATLMDFGLVKALESSESLTSAGTILGSPEYMAPEQADPDRKSEIGPATDRYALGVVAYHMLTGRAPFDADSPLAVMRGHADKVPPNPQDIRKDMPKSMAQVLLKALSKAPGERYPTARTMVGALRQAERDTLALEEKKAAKRERRLAPRRFPLWVWGAVSALFLALLVVGVLSGPRFRGKTTPKPTVTTAVAVKATDTSFATDTSRPPTATPMRTPTNTSIPPTATTTHTPPPQTVIHVVQPGETLAHIVLQYNTTMEAVIRANHLLDPDAIWVGQALLIPGPEAGVGQGDLIPPTPTPTDTPVTPTPPPALPAAIVTQVWEKDGSVMVYVPAGKFWMGSPDSDTLAYDDEKPQREVYLDAFWMDRTEVTNAQYRSCMDDGACGPPSCFEPWTPRGSDYGNPEFDDYPVICVDWNQATAYCTWAGKRLPTEEEWEKAARGTDGRQYPWGDTFDSSLCNSNENEMYATMPVGKFSPGGDSPYGIADMAGNVLEWTDSWQDERQKRRVARGGAWNHSQRHSRAACRILLEPSNGRDGVGFRCARSDSGS